MSAQEKNESIVITRKQIIAVFDEWAKEATEKPENFEKMVDGKNKPQPDYGKHCAITFIDKAHKFGAQTIPF